MDLCGVPTRCFSHLCVYGEQKQRYLEHCPLGYYSKNLLEHHTTEDTPPPPPFILESLENTEKYKKTFCCTPETQHCKPIIPQFKK